MIGGLWLEMPNKLPGQIYAGAIPRELSQLDALETIHLCVNQFSGEILVENAQAAHRLWAFYVVGTHACSSPLGSSFQQISFLRIVPMNSFAPSIF